jgi:hypothetical protein
MIKLMTLLSLLMVGHAFGYGESNKSIYSAKYLEQFSESEIVPLKAKQKGFLRFEVLKDIKFMGIDLMPGDKVRIYNGTLYSIKLSQPRKIYGIMVSDRKRVVFSNESNTLQRFVLEEDTIIDGIKWPAKSKIKMLLRKSRAGGMLRSVKLSKNLSIGGVDYKKGQNLAFSALSGKITVTRDRAKKKDRLNKLKAKARKRKMHNKRKKQKAQ